METQHRARKFMFFALGIAVPIAGYFLWSSTGRFSSKKRHREQLQEKAVEDSFPASDPPANW